MMPATPVVLNGRIQIVHQRLYNKGGLLAACEVWDPLKDRLTMAWLNQMQTMDGKVPKAKDIVLINWEKAIRSIGIKFYIDAEGNVFFGPWNKESKEKAIEHVLEMIERYKGR